MGKTYKKFKSFRRPKGKLNAKIHNARSIPPDSWEDLPIDPQCYLPFRLAIKMLEEGFPPELIVRKLYNKFKIKPSRVLQIIKNYQQQKSGN